MTSEASCVGEIIHIEIIFLLINYMTTGSSLIID
jgi:hypothetical protein